MLSIAIPTYKNFNILIQCLKSLTANVEYPYQIYVVNNGPAESDGIKFEEAVHEIIHFPDLHIIQAERNLGWAGGINLAFEKAEPTPHFCMLNDDVVFVPGDPLFFRRLCRHLIDTPEIGAVGPSSNFVMGPQNFLDFRGIIACPTLLVGFCLVIRSELFAEIGGLDDGLPGGDDLDLSIMVRKAGYKLLMDKSCYLHHHGCVTGNKVHSGWWNSTEHQELTNNMLIQKHGLKWWHETLSPIFETAPPGLEPGDSESGWITSAVEGLNSGLDVGCGSNKTVPRAIGVDLHGKGLMGRAGGTKGVPSVADIEDDALILSKFEDESQDFIISRHCLEHLIDPLRGLRTWYQKLKPGGVLALAVPNHDSIETMVIDYTHLHAFNPDSIRNLVEAVGFVVEDMAHGLSIALKARKQ